jgi:hypothetical protein
VLYYYISHFGLATLGPEKTVWAKPVGGIIAVELSFGKRFFHDSLCNLYRSLKLGDIKLLHGIAISKFFVYRFMTFGGSIRQIRNYPFKYP